MEATKDIKVLVSNESASYSSETIVYNDNKFKIVAQNGNCYSRMTVEIYTKNGDLGLLATQHDIPDYKYVDYTWDESKRRTGNKNNISAAENYIKKIF